jgi:hypothetical protein
MANLDNPKPLHRWLLIFLGVLIASGAHFFSTGLAGFRPLVWVAPVPVLLIAFNASARSAQEGLLTISDYKGRVLAEDSSSRLSEVLLVGEIRPGPGRAIYSLTGSQLFQTFHVWLLLAAASRQKTFQISFM